MKFEIKSLDKSNWIVFLHYNGKLLSYNNLFDSKKRAIEFIKNYN